jgi:hypothetical protein
VSSPEDTAFDHAITAAPLLSVATAPVLGPEAALILGSATAFFGDLIAPLRKKRLEDAWSLFPASCGLARNFLQMFLFRMGVGVAVARHSWRQRISLPSGLQRSFPLHLSAETY